MRKIMIGMIAVIILIAGSILVSAAMDNDKTEYQTSTAGNVVTDNAASAPSVPTGNCGCGSSSCDGACGGSCGVSSCGCGR